MPNGFLAFDCDGHVRERDDELSLYYEGAYSNLRRPETHSIFPSLDGWFRGSMIGFGDAKRKYMHTDDGVWAEILELLDLEGSVLFPTAGLAVGLLRDPTFATATATAYNSWLEDRYTKHDGLFGAALLPVQDPAAAARELERRLRDRSRFVTAVLPTRLAMSRSYGDEFFFPIFEAAERLGIPLAMHGGPSMGFGLDHQTEFVKVHTLEHAVPTFIHLTDIIFSGVFDTFPDLRIVCLESGASWVPWMMDRLDYEYNGLLGAGVRKRLKKRPSRYFTEGDNLWFSLELEEHLALKYTLDAIGSEHLMYASDYPHEPKEGEMKFELEEFLDDAQLATDVKERIAYHNAKRLYGIPAGVSANR
jgi:predicted TIM-barrel fold metal-dependent hydrolase